ncbi:MAG: GlmU family protein [Flavobacteriaceae bacterium]|jgi:UDP-N-acetylglucosamine diphosphorylase/glucosamine-1-phosphate N-acetyltransferase|nr:GlmU family protein [Flavobacteriaceae bacterium]
MNIILFDGEERSNLLPLTFTRPVAELRMGILTFTERWKKILETDQISFLTEKYLSEKYPTRKEAENLFINPAYFPDRDLILTLKNLQLGEALFCNDTIVAANASFENFQAQKFMHKKEIELTSFHIQYAWDLFTYNSQAIAYDFKLLTQGKKSQPLSNTVRVIGDESGIFAEEGVVAECVILNSTEGEIYLGKNSKILEGAMIRGSFALCEGAQINMGAKVYGATTIGPYSKIGGEVNNIVVTGYSSKGHDGFLGNSVLGEWCNLGADTNSSNLKNNYSKVQCWNYAASQFINTNLQFAGLIMGDHSKSAINTQFNTGTVVGAFANIFISGFPPKLIPSFSWGGGKGNPKFELDKAFEVAEKVMERRHIPFTEKDKRIIEELYQMAD